MKKFRILVVNADEKVYEDYIEIPDVDSSVGDYGIAIAKKIEELYGVRAEEKKFPKLSIMDGTYDSVTKTEIGYYKLEPDNREGKYQYLFFKRIINGEVDLLETLIPVMGSLEEGDIENIKEQLFG